MTKELIEYAEQFLRLGYRIAQENALTFRDEEYGQEHLYISWQDADAELEKAVEEMKKATLGQESSQLELDFNCSICNQIPCILEDQQ